MVNRSTIMYAGSDRTQYFLVAVGVALQQGTSFICKCHLIAEALGCQCKWYLGRSPLLCRSTAVNRMQVHTKLAIPFNSRGHLGHLVAVKTCLSGKKGKHIFFSEAPGPKAPGPKRMQSLFLQGHHGVQKHHHPCWLTWCWSKQGISFICECHLIAESLGFPCKWYWGRSPLLCWSKTVKGSTFMHAGRVRVYRGTMVYGATIMHAGLQPHAILKHLVVVYSKVYPSYASTI